MFEIVVEHLKQPGYRVSCFTTAAIDGQSVGFGGSVTLEQMGLYERLGRHSTVFWHQGVADKEKSRQLRIRAAQADIYLSSVNGLAETGEIVNIDGTCNRVASIFYGHRKVYGGGEEQDRQRLRRRPVPPGQTGAMTAKAPRASAAAFPCCGKRP